MVQQMTELALSGLATPLLGGYLNPPGNRRSEQANTEAEATAKRELPREAERVVSGEVLTASENTYSHLNNSQSRFSQANTDTDTGSSSAASGQARRFSLQAAIQSFRDNEAIVVDQRRAVQVSGIIDEYA
jgi:hypothetical protein